MPDTIFQRQFSIRQQEGLPGMLAHSQVPHFALQCLAGVALRPGDGVYIDRADGKVKLPTSAAERGDVCGIVLYNQDSPEKTAAAVPATAQSAQYIEIDADNPVRVGFLGIYWGLAGETLQPGDDVEFNQTTRRWIRQNTDYANVTMATLPKFKARLMNNANVVADSLAAIYFSNSPNK